MEKPEEIAKDIEDLCLTENVSIADSSGSSDVDVNDLWIYINYIINSLR